ncbi:GTPase-activating protein GYP8 PWA37_005026 [Arxiozyma heterogenica]
MMSNGVANHFELTNESDKIKKAKNLKSKIIFEKLNSIGINNNSQLENLSLSLLGITEFGFINNSIRKKCWVYLLTHQMDRMRKEDDELINVETNNLPHKDEDQVRLDTDRSFGYIKDSILKNRLKRILYDIIIGTLKRNPQLNYYQGYHDVASIFVMIYYEDIVKNKYKKQINEMILILEIFTLMYLRDFMMDSLDFTIDQLKIVTQILMKMNKKFVNKLKLDKQEPFYMISSVLTIYSHHFKPKINQKYQDESNLIYEIFDMVICSQSMILPLIIYSKFLLNNKNLLLKEYETNLEHFDNINDLIHASIQNAIVRSFQYTEKNRDHLKQWYTILNEIRFSFINNKIKIPSLKGQINKYSPLLTTATNYNLKHFQFKTYDEVDLKSLMNKGIKLNKIRQNMDERQTKKLYRQQNYPFLLKILDDQYMNLSPLIKISVCIAILALCIKYSDQSSNGFILKIYHNMLFQNILPKMKVRLTSSLK